MGNAAATFLRIDIQMRNGFLRGDREVFPIRQDVDGDEIDRVIDVASSAARIPRHRHRSPAHSAWLFTLRMVAARSCAVISPRSSTSLPTMSARITSGYCLASRIAVSISTLFFAALPDSQMPCMTFKPCRLAISGDAVEPEFDRIGAHAIGDLRKPGEIVVDLLGRNLDRRRRAGSASRETARRRRNRAFRPAANGDGGIATGCPIHHQAAAMTATAHANRAAGMAARNNECSVMWRGNRCRTLSLAKRSVPSAAS